MMADEIASFWGLNIAMIALDVLDPVSVVSTSLANFVMIELCFDLPWRRSVIQSDQKIESEEEESKHI